MVEKCKHQWGLVLVEYKNRIVSSSARICIKCGLLKIGDQTIRISKNRIDMDGRPIRNVSRIDIAERLRIPVGLDMYD